MPTSPKKEAVIAKFLEDLERVFRDETLSFIREKLASSLGDAPAAAKRPKKTAAAPKKAAAKKAKGAKRSGRSKPAAVLAAESDGGGR